MSGLWVLIWLACAAFAGEYDLLLGGMRFDPLDQNRQQVATEWLTPAASQPSQDLQLIQLLGPTQASDLQMLRDAGYQPLQYIHPYTYIVWPQSQTTAKRFAVLDPQRVRWQGYFQPAYRVLPEYRRANNNILQSYVLATFVGVSSANLLQSLEQLGARDVRLTSQGQTVNLFHFQTRAENLLQMARLAGVYAIQPAAEMLLRNEFSKQLNRGLRNTGSGVPTGYLMWLDEIGVDGSGVRVAIVDSGVMETHPDLIDGMVDCSDPIACGSGGVSVHGTHVAGIVGGRHALDSSEVGTGYLEGVGVAPGVTLLDIRSANWANIGIDGLMQLTRQNGAYISNNSWGTSSQPRGYDLYSRQVDVGVRDADLTTAGLQPLIYVQAIENGFGGVTSIGAPEEAKSAIRVGSTRVRNSDGSLRSDVDALSFNSAHGPGLDGRNIPDLVAPGCYVRSTDSNSSYRGLCGTSMATPHVAGTAALFVEQYRNQFGIEPSPALVKAGLLAASQSLIGELDADDVVMSALLDGRQGYGMLHANALMQPQVPIYYEDQTVVFAGSGEVWQETIEVVDPTKPVRVMLVWTDAPGHGLGGSTPAISNNLNLSVLADGNTYRGNVFDANGLSVIGGVADTLNTTEGLFFAAGQLDDFELRVDAANIAWDAIPDNGTLTDQDFAIYCYNCQPQAGFAFSQTAADVALCREQSAQGTVMLKPINGFEGDVEIEAINLPDGVMVTFDPAVAAVDALRNFSVAVDASAVAGTYAISLHAFEVGGQASFSSFSLRISDSVPSIPLTLLPDADSVNVSVRPQFVWQSNLDNRFQLELLDAADQLLNSYEIDAGTTFQLPEVLEPFTVYGWRVTALNPCGAGLASPTRYFRTRFIAPILLVDDDDNAPDVRAIYTAAMAAQGWRFDVWDTQDSAVEPQLSDLEPYQWVVWFSGAARIASAIKAGPSIATLPHLSAYIDNGGSLWMISANLFSRSLLAQNAALDSFLEDVLGVGSGTANSGQQTIFGTVNSPFQDLSYTLQHIYPDNSDSISPVGASSLMFAGSIGNAGVYRHAAKQRTAFWSFPFEAIAPQERDAAMAQMGLYLNTLHFEGCFGLQDIQRRAAETWPQKQDHALFEIIACVDAFAID